MEFRLSKKAVHLRRCMMDAFHLRNATDMIFFNAGQPAVSILPAAMLREVWDDMLTSEPQVLAYPSARGDEEFRHIGFVAGEGVADLAHRRDHRRI